MLCEDESDSFDSSSVDDELSDEAFDEVGDDEDESDEGFTGLPTSSKIDMATGKCKNAERKEYA